MGALRFYSKEENENRQFIWEVERSPCYEELRRKILDRQPIGSIVRFARRKNGFPGLTPRQIRIRIDAYIRSREHILFGIEFGGKSLRERIKRVTRIADELEELGELYGIQKKRIVRFSETEEGLMIPLKHIDEAINLAVKILETSANMKAEFGVLHRAPVEMTVNVQDRISTLVDARYGKQSLMQVLSDPSKRSRVANIAERLLSNPTLQNALLKRIQDVSDGKTLEREHELQPEATVESNDNAEEPAPEI